jgi:ribose transport system permease protein
MMANPHAEREKDASRSAALSRSPLLVPDDGPHRSTFLRLLGTYGTIIVLVVMLVAFSIVEPGTFATIGNFRNILNDMAIGTIVAGGLTIPLVAGDFDLSIGYVASFCGLLLVGLLSFNQLPIPLAVLAVVAIGAVIGVVNGVIVSKLGVNAFIATLGTGTLVVGLNYAYSGGIPHSYPLARVYQYRHWQVLGAAPCDHGGPVAHAWVFLDRTVQGQHIVSLVRSTGRCCGRPQSTRVRRRETAPPLRRAHGVQSRSGQVTAGDVSHISAAFLGSAALKEGQFHILGTLIGVLTVAVGNNGLAMIGAPIFTQFLFAGLLLVVAVALSSIGRRYGRDS